MSGNESDAAETDLGQCQLTPNVATIQRHPIEIIVQEQRLNLTHRCLSGSDSEGMAKEINFSHYFLNILAPLFQMMEMLITSKLLRLIQEMMAWNLDFGTLKLGEKDFYLKRITKRWSVIEWYGNLVDILILVVCTFLRMFCQKTWTVWT